MLLLSTNLPFDHGPVSVGLEAIDDDLMNMHDLLLCLGPMLPNATTSFTINRSNNAGNVLGIGDD